MHLQNNTTNNNLFDKKNDNYLLACPTNRNSHLIMTSQAVQLITSLAACFIQLFPEMVT